MDELDIAPRRALPPVPPPPRGGTPALVVPVAADETSWYDPHDLLEDSAVRPSSGALAAVDTLDRSGSAAEAAHDLLLESGRHLVLDDALLAALDAAAKAAEARRAITAGALAPTSSGLTALFTPAGPTTGAAPARALGPSTEVSAVRPALPALPALRATAVAPAHPAPADPAPAVTDVVDAEIVDAEVLDDEVLDDEVLDDEVLADEVHDGEVHDGEVHDDEVHAEPVDGLDPLAVDVAAEFARHDDLVETGRHAALDDDLGYPTGRHSAVSATDTGRHGLVEDDGLDGLDGLGGSGDAHGSAAGVPTVGTLTHRTVVTRSSGRRWIPVGVGAGVLSIVAAVLLTSGFASNGPTTGTDEAARTGAGSSAPATSSPPTPSPSAPAMNTLDLSGPVVVDDSAQPEDVADTRPTAAAGRSTAAVAPQVATPPTSSTGPTPGGSSESVGDESTSAQPSVLTAETGPPSGGSTGTSSTGSSSTSPSSASTAAPETLD